MRHLLRLFAALALISAVAFGPAAAYADPTPSASASASATASASTTSSAPAALIAPKCDAAYITYKADKCVPATTGKVNCKSFKYQIHLVSATNDPHGLDEHGVGNGIGCESNKPWPKVATTTKPAASTITGSASLPNTGFPTDLVAAIGGTLVLGGAGAVLLGRRRRAEFSA